MEKITVTPMALKRTRKNFDDKNRKKLNARYYNSSLLIATNATPNTFSA
jgi:hypothetical protein